MTAESTLASSPNWGKPPNSTFLNLLLEIRRKIYYLALVFQYDSCNRTLWGNEIESTNGTNGLVCQRIRQAIPFLSCVFPTLIVPTTLVSFPIGKMVTKLLQTPEEKNEYRHRIYWGTPLSTNLYPVNKQWYAEIQGALYSKFVFVLHVQLRDGKLRDMLCSILPPKAFESIRRMKFIFNVPWKYIDRGFDKDLINETQALLSRFSLLRSVRIRFRHPGDETQTSSSTNDNGRGHYIPPTLEPRALEAMLVLGRLFQHMDDISVIILHTIEYLEEDARTRALEVQQWEEEGLECERGLECENLAISCVYILHREFRAAIGCNIPRMYVGSEEHCSIWGLDRWNVGRFMDAKKWDTDIRMQCLE